MCERSDKTLPSGLRTSWLPHASYIYFTTTSPLESSIATISPGDIFTVEIISNISITSACGVRLRTIKRLNYRSFSASERAVASG